MEWFSVRRDGIALALLVLSIVMIGAGLSNHPRLFGYSVVLFIGLLAGLGFVRRHLQATWWPPALATMILLASLGGAFAYEAVPVNGPDDTLLGFQQGTAFVVYGIWVPALFTLGLTYVLLFERLAERRPASPGDRD